LISVVGVLMGMLLWIKKPDQTDCEVAKVGEIKFFCGRKGKFGLCFQGICDSEHHFLDVCIAHPASTSDYLAFCTSSLKHKLEKEGFLAPGLCLFSNSAYVNNEYMATPFKGVSSGPEDNYNFFQSQVRIKNSVVLLFLCQNCLSHSLWLLLQLQISVECCFGIFVNCWGILQKALRSSITLRRKTSLVMSLCRLHNYCINCQMSSDDPKADKSLDKDNISITINEGIPMDDGGIATPEDSSDIGQLLKDVHFDDFTEVQKQQMTCLERKRHPSLPREKLLKVVENKGLKQPTPQKRNATKPNKNKNKK
jgi:hypothetical protein